MGGMMESNITGILRGMCVPPPSAHSQPALTRARNCHQHHRRRWQLTSATQGCTSCASLPAWLWENGEEMEREWGNGERFTLYISSISLYFLPLYSFPISKVSKLQAIQKMQIIQFLIQEMDREGGNNERMRKCREWISLHFLEGWLQGSSGLHNPADC